MSGSNGLFSTLINTIEMGKALEGMLELERDKKDLRNQGLTEEEIEGFEEMFIDGYLPTKVKTYEN